MMDTPCARAKAIGHKKKLVNRNSVIDNIYGHAISTAITDGTAFDSCVFSRVISEHVKAGGYLHACDSKTGETFFHVLAKTAGLYLGAKAVRLFYDLGTKIDLDVQDHLGDTVLHKICLVPGAWRCIIAVLRCGASSLIRNNSGFKPEELILQHKRERWEENLYWLRKFSPGLWELPKSELPDANSLMIRLLKSWCRTSKVFGDTLKNLKTHCQVNRIEMMCVVTMEKYEYSNELALAVMSGSKGMMDTILNSVAPDQVDVNTLDHSYQYSYPDSPTSPRPLIAAAWETENYELVKRLMTLKPDLSVKYTFEAEACRLPKPLFFHLVNPKSRPENANITAAVLQGSDLNLRNEKGETILFEAIYNNETATIIQTILNCGVNIAARDLKGRTAVDHCILLKRNDYKDLIDSHVVKMATDLNVEGLMDLVCQMYEHFPLDCKGRISKLPKSDRQVQILHILKNFHCAQMTITKLFGYAKEGNFTQFLKNYTMQFARARDKAGRSLLHYAVQWSAPVSKVDKSSLDVKNGDEIMDNISTISIDKHNRQFEPKPDTDKLHLNTKEKKHCRVSDLFHCKHCKPEHFSIMCLLLNEYPHIAGITNNLGQTALHFAYIYSVSKTVLDVLEKVGNCNKLEDIFGFVPNDYDREVCGEQTYKSRRKPVDEMDLNIFLTESQFDDHLKKALQTGQLCKLRSLVNQLIEHGGIPCYNNILFDCLDANRISLATYLIQKGFKTNISKQYDTCRPDNPMCAMMECSHAVTTLYDRALQVGATDVVSLINKRKKEKSGE